MDEESLEDVEALEAVVKLVEEARLQSSGEEREDAKKHLQAKQLGREASSATTVRHHGVAMTMDQKHLSHGILTCLRLTHCIMHRAPKARIRTQPHRARDAVQMLKQRPCQMSI